MGKQSKKIQIYINFEWKNFTILMEVSGKEKISDLKNKIKQNQQFESETKLTLIYLGKELLDAKNLSDCGVSDGSTIQLISNYTFM